MGPWTIKHTYRKGDAILIISWGPTWRWHWPDDLQVEITITSELFHNDVLDDTQTVTLEANPRHK